MGERYARARAADGSSYQYHLARINELQLYTKTMFSTTKEAKRRGVIAQIAKQWQLKADESKLKDQKVLDRLLMSLTIKIKKATDAKGSAAGDAMWSLGETSLSSNPGHLMGHPSKSTLLSNSRNPPNGCSATPNADAVVPFESSQKELPLHPALEEAESEHHQNGNGTKNSS